MNHWASLGRKGRVWVDTGLWAEVGEVGILRAKAGKGPLLPSPCPLLPAFSRLLPFSSPLLLFCPPPSLLVTHFWLTSFSLFMSTRLESSYQGQDLASSHLENWYLAGKEEGSSYPGPTGYQDAAQHLHTLPQHPWQGLCIFFWWGNQDKVITSTCPARTPYSRSQKYTKISQVSEFTRGRRIVGLEKTKGLLKRCVLMLMLVRKTELTS